MLNYLVSPLSDLRHHWGDAYAISGILGCWRAQRRDDRCTLSAGDPEKLREVIRADYHAKPVPRDFDRLPASLGSGAGGEGAVAPRGDRPSSRIRRTVPLPPWELGGA